MSEHRRQDYPTTSQMEEIYNSWRAKGKDGIKEALRKLYPRTKDEVLKPKPKSKPH